ncbi:hypothetical protein [Neobacillus cucumis]|nr:hypothetical protein [Neobacillus cucumis]
MAISVFVVLSAETGFQLAKRGVPSAITALQLAKHKTLHPS